MATIFTTTLPAQHITDAEFQGEVQFYHNTFALGLTQTADTGQLNPATVTRPLASNAVQGYEVWRLNDTLQATKPVFMKVEYGSGSGSQHQLSIWFTIGTSTNGAGTITGTILQARTQIMGGNQGANLQNAYGSAATNRFTIATHLSTGGNTVPLFLGLERTKDSAGADTGTGIILGYGGSNTHRSVLAPFLATPPTPEVGMQFILSTNNPTTYVGDQGIGLMIPMLGVAQQPGLNFLITVGNDFANFAQPSFNIYGGTHTWQHCGGNIQNLRAANAGNTDSTTRLMIRFE